MAILHVTLSHENLNSYSYQVCVHFTFVRKYYNLSRISVLHFQVFRALANLMELTNYSITFYIYCLFSEDFRSTLFRTLKWPWIGNPICNQRKDEVNNWHGQNRKCIFLFRSKFQMQTRPIIKAKKLPNKSNHIHHTTTSGLCTLGRSSSI